VNRVVATVLSPDQAVPLRHVAAVTFTEKAGAELRDRLRVAFESELGAAEPGSERAVRADEALQDLDAAAIGTLHSFAERILGEHPIEAGLPPLIEVRDEVASGVAFDDRWTVLRTALLDDPGLARHSQMPTAAAPAPNCSPAPVQTRRRRCRSKPHPREPEPVPVPVHRSSRHRLTKTGTATSRGSANARPGRPR
jgi:hypothetical protein